MKLARAVQMISLAVVMSFSATGRADIISHTFDMVIFENADGADTTGLLFTVEVTNEAIGGGELDANQARFRIENASIADSVLTAIYWQDGVLLGIQEIFQDETIVLFQEGNDTVSPAVLPGGQNIGFVTTRMDGAWTLDADNPSPFYGLNPGEFVDVIFELEAGGTASILIDQMLSLDVLVGAHIQAIGEDDLSISGATIPAPGALFLGAIGIGLVAWVKRRFGLESAGDRPGG